MNIFGLIVVGSGLAHEPWLRCLVALAERSTLLPTFLVIGAMKCGTTTLDRYFRSHPQVSVPKVKETDFFSRQSIWDRGLTWYESLFDADNSVARGECCPSYKMADRYPTAASRIGATIPNARLVYMVREPLSRVISMYKHYVYRGEERRPFPVAIEADPRYLSASLYGWHLRMYQKYFDPGRIAVFSTEELERDPRLIINSICRFIGIPIRPEEGYPHAHRSDTKRRPLPWAVGPGAFVKDPIWGLDKIPKTCQLLVGRKFKDDSEIMSDFVARGLRSRLSEDRLIVRDFVGQARFDTWSW